MPQIRHPEDLPPARGGRSLASILGSVNWAGVRTLDPRPYRPEVFEQEALRLAQENAEIDRYNQYMETNAVYPVSSEERAAMDEVLSKERRVRKEMSNLEDYETALSGL